MSHTLAANKASYVAILAPWGPFGHPTLADCNRKNMLMRSCDGRCFVSVASHVSSPSKIGKCLNYSFNYKRECTIMKWP